MMELSCLRSDMENIRAPHAFKDYVKVYHM